MNIAYDVRRIEEYMQAFYRLTHIKSVVWDSQFTAIAAAPSEESTLCTALHRHPTARALCAQCTQKGLERCRRERRAVVYTCHAGLTEAVTPILMGDIIVGYMMLGQVRLADSDPAAIEAYVTPYVGQAAADYIQVLESRDETAINDSLRMLQGCTGYLLMNRLIKEDHGGMAVKLSRYIESHPTDDLSTNGLCARFGLSRNRLYRLSNTYFGMPIARYVRQKRLQYAQERIGKGVSVTQAAADAGFADYGYFGKLFKQYHGKTPMQARNEDA